MNRSFYFMFTSILIIILFFFFFFSVLILPSFISFFLLLFYSAFMYNFSVNYVHWMHRTCTTSSRKAATKTKHLPLNSQHVTSNVYQKCNEHRFHHRVLYGCFIPWNIPFSIFLIRALIISIFRFVFCSRAIYSDICMLLLLLHQNVSFHLQMHKNK